MATSGGGGINGLAVAVATGGALLVYSGFRGVNPVAALRAVSGGRPMAVSTTGTTADTAAYSTGTLSGGTHPELAQAALAAQDEIYSQAKRWEDGYSDCSSFIGKRFKEVGITPPGASVTMSYRVWGQLHTIDRSQIGAGDLLCGTGHIAMALSPTMAIGQQRPGVNVKIDTIDSIMFGQTGWVPRRYAGAAAGKGAGVIAA